MEPNRPAASESVVEAARRIHAARTAEVAPYAAFYPLLLGQMSVITRVIDRAMSDATRATVLGCRRAEMETNGL